MKTSKIVLKIFYLTLGVFVSPILAFIAITPILAYCDRVDSVPLNSTLLVMIMPSITILTITFTALLNKKIRTCIVAAFLVNFIAIYLMQVKFEQFTNPNCEWIFFKYAAKEEYL